MAWFLGVRLCTCVMNVRKLTVQTQVYELYFSEKNEEYYSHLKM
jgi:hypothetical protein